RLYPFIPMSKETKKVKNILENYEDRERLEIILTLVKKGEVSVDQAILLIQGDRNYLATQTLQEVRDRIQPYQNPWVINTPPYTGGSGTTITYTTTGDNTPF